MTLRLSSATKDRFPMLDVLFLIVNNRCVDTPDLVHYICAIHKSGAAQRCDRSAKSEPANLDHSIDMNLPNQEIATTLTLADQMARQIAAKIIDGTYAEGVSMPEQLIAGMFNVSRGPVRDALRLLERDGLVTIVPRKGARVTSLSTEEVAELFEIRSALFALAARLCALRVNDDKLARLEELFGPIKAYRPAPDRDSMDYSVISAELANAVVRMSGNRRLRSMLDPVMLQAQRYSRLGLSTVSRQRASIASWTQMMTALRVGDDDSAERIAKEMVDRTGAFAAARLSEEKNK
jgi:DNA-binding GntR family transcriptional regulator